MQRALGTMLVGFASLAIACFDAAPGEGEGEGEAGGGEGEPSGEPLVESDEPVCELGVVVVGDTATCTITLRNRGTAPATLAGATTNAPFIVVDNVTGTLLPGAVDTARLTIAGTPTTAGTFEETITIAVDESEPLLIPARVTGHCVPTAIIVAPARALVGEDVTLSATTSVTCLGAPIATYQWLIVSQAASANASIALADQPTATLSNRSLGAVDVALFVADDEGFGTEARATVSFDARLSFSVADALVLGLEPHVYRASDVRCSADDCFDGEGCGFLAAAPPEWDGDAGRTAGDPLFEESDGVLVAAPADGAYVVSVYARDDASANAALTVDGVANTSSRPLVAGDFWIVADVNVAGGVGTVTTVNTLENGVACP